MECLDALKGQSYPLDGIYIIDNASTDGTPKLLLEKGYISELPPQSLKEPWEKEFSITNDQKVDIKIHYVRMNENTGGSGGFYEGIKRAYERKYDWIWIMDDDTIPSSEALYNLLKFKDIDNVGLLCSHVTWIDGTPHMMNIPSVRSCILDGKVHPFNERIDSGLLGISSCSFVSSLISSKSVQSVGFPIKEMFIYADDVEFTERISKKFLCYYVFNSKVTHKTKQNLGTDIMKVSSDKLEYYFFDIRNNIYIARKKGFLVFLKFLIYRWTLNYLFRAIKRKDSKVKAVIICIKGFFAGIFFYPKIEKGGLRK